MTAHSVVPEFRCDGCGIEMTQGQVRAGLAHHCGGVFQPLPAPTEGPAPHADDRYAAMTDEALDFSEYADLRNALLDAEAEFNAAAEDVSTGTPPSEWYHRARERYMSALNQCDGFVRSLLARLRAAAADGEREGNLPERFARIPLPTKPQLREWSWDLARLAHYLLEPSGQGYTKAEASRRCAFIALCLDPTLEREGLGNAEQFVAKFTLPAARSRPTPTADRQAAENG